MAEPKGFLVVPLGFNPSGILRALELDESDRLKVLVDSITGIVSVSLDGQTGTLKVAQQSPSSLATGNHGWISGAWQKSPIPFGASGFVEESLVSTTLPAGTSFLSGTACPAGEMWVISNIAIRYTGTVAGVTINARIVNSVNIDVFGVTPPVSGQYYDRQGHWVIFPGGYVRQLIIGATLNDDASLQYTGYKLDIDQ